MFSAEKAAFFVCFAVFFDAFCRRNSGEVLCIVRERILDLVIEDCKMQKNGRIFTLEGTQCVVRIFEGFRALCGVGKSGFLGSEPR